MSMERVRGKIVSDWDDQPHDVVSRDPEHVTYITVGSGTLQYTIRQMLKLVRSGLLFILDIISFEIGTNCFNHAKMSLFGLTLLGPS